MTPQTADAIALAIRALQRERDRLDDTARLERRVFRRGVSRQSVAGIPL